MGSVEQRRQMVSTLQEESTDTGKKISGKNNNSDIKNNNENNDNSYNINNSKYNNNNNWNNKNSNENNNSANIGYKNNPTSNHNNKSNSSHIGYNIQNAVHNNRTKNKGIGDYKNNISSQSTTKENKWEQRNSMHSGASTQIEEVDKKWFLSSYRCDLTQLKKLVQDNVQLINSRDFATGFAAIHWAAKMGRIDIITWLKENDADVNLRTHGGYSALHIATMHNNKEVVNKLITHFNADINVRDYSGRKPGFYLQQTTQQQMSNIDQIGPSGRHLFTSAPNVRHSLSNSFTMPDIAGEMHNVDTLPKKKKKGISLSNSFKGKRKFSIVKRREGEGKGEDENSSLSSNDRTMWRKSLSVPDITISEPVVVFEQDI